MPSGRSAPIPPDRPTATAADTGRGSGERGVPHRPGGTPRSAGALSMQHIDEEVPHVPAFTTHTTGEARTGGRAGLAPPRVNV